MSEQQKITLTLTREQVKILKKCFGHIQWWSLSKKALESIECLEKQIEEKLK